MSQALTVAKQTEREVMQEPSIASHYDKSRLDRNREEFADKLRELLGQKDDFLYSLNNLVNMQNETAAKLIFSMDKDAQITLLAWLLPAARIGLTQSIILMEDKMTIEGKQRAALAMREHRKANARRRIVKDHKKQKTRRRS